MNTLFYSPKCKHCNNLMNMINSNNFIKNKFTFENIHDTNHEQISNIRSVPTIFQHENSRFLIGTKAYDYVKKELELNLNAFEDYSTFSFISQPENALNNNSNFAFLTRDGYNVPNSIDSNLQANNNSGQSSKEKAQNSAFEAYVEKRKNDIPQAIKRV